MENVIIIDDHPVVRLAVRALLERSDYNVLAETHDAQAALDMVKMLNPALVIVDIDILPISGIDVVHHLRKEGFTGKILVFTDRKEDVYIKLCIEAGANGFVSKDNNLANLIDAVNAIQAGYSYFPMSQGYSNPVSSEPFEEASMIASLSARELQVIKYLSSGMGNMQVAKFLKISNKTVSAHKSRILLKLGISNQVQLADFARRHHLD